MSVKTIISTDKAPLPVGAYNQAVQVAANAQLLFLAGQIPLDPATGKLIEGAIAAQTEQVLQNIQAVLNAAGADFSHVVKSTIYLADMADFAAVNQIYTKYFTELAPARSCVQVARLPLDARVEIECIAAL